ncbi:MAG: S24/S26 family peptidase [Nannocystales bacterium]
MRPKVNDGDLVTVEPLAADVELVVGDIVLCTVRGSQYLHLIKALSPGRAQIGNNRGGINGWVGHAAIHGRCTEVQRSATARGGTQDA